MIPAPLRKWWWEWEAGDDRPHVISTTFPVPCDTPYLPPEPPRRDHPELGDEPSPPFPEGWSGDARGGIIQLQSDGEHGPDTWIIEIHVHGARRIDRERRKKAGRRRAKPQDPQLFS